MSGVCLIIQIITGVTLAMHYNPSVAEEFSVGHIMRDVKILLTSDLCSYTYSFLKFSGFPIYDRVLLERFNI
jgi:hypothetical protein